MSIGESIRNLRKKAGFTQKQLAEKVGVNEVTIRSYEAEKYNPKINTLTKLCVALDCKITDLIDEDSKKYYRMFDNEKVTENTDYVHSYSYASSEEEFNKLQKERQIEIEKKKHNNVHKYDGSIRVNPNPERERLDEEATEIFKRQVSGEEITEEEAQKVSDYIERTREDYDKLSESIKNLAKVLGMYLNESTQISSESFQLLKEKLQILTDMIPTMPDFYENLNDIGRKKAAEQIDLLTKIPEYQKKPEEPPQD